MENSNQNSYKKNTKLALIVFFILLLILITATVIFYNILNNNLNNNSSNNQNGNESNVVSDGNNNDNDDLTPINPEVPGENEVFTYTSTQDDIIRYAQKRYDGNTTVMLNKKIYVTFNGLTLTRVPADFNQNPIENVYDTSYQISAENTTFYCDYSKKTDNSTKDCKEILHTSDQGKTWSICVAPSGGDVKYLQFFNAKDGILIIYNQYAMNTAEAFIYTTTDYGKNWTKVSTQDLQKDCSISFTSLNDGRITERFDNSIVLMNTVDGGKTFTKSNIELKNYDSSNSEFDGTDGDNY